MQFQHCDAWNDVMYELVCHIDHRKTHEANVQRAYRGRQNDHRYWGTSLEIIVHRRERRWAQRIAKRFPIQSVMSDRKIRLLFITPGVGDHLLSFIDHRWLLDNVFDPNEWVRGPKLHVLPSEFVHKQRYHNIRSQLTEFCKAHNLDNSPTNQVAYSLTRGAKSALMNSEWEYNNLITDHSMANWKFGRQGDNDQLIRRLMQYTVFGIWDDKGAIPVTLKQFMVAMMPYPVHGSCKNINPGSCKKWKVAQIPSFLQNELWLTVGPRHWVEVWENTKPQDYTTPYFRYQKYRTVSLNTFNPQWWNTRPN